MPEPWRVLERTITFSDRWLTVRSDRCLLPSGQIVDPYHVIESPAVANVVALTESMEIVLVREYRHAVARVVLGIPGGMVDPTDGSPESAMRRELEEETGFSGGEWRLIGRTLADPSKQTNEIHSFLALGVREGQARKLDPTEEIEVVRRPFLEFVGQVWAGDLIHVHHVAAVHLAVAHLLRGRECDLAPLRQGLRAALLDPWDPTHERGTQSV